MSLERHAFISYAHIDNEPLTPEQKGWVTLFHSTLQTMLSQRLGGKADIWRDDKLDGNDIFSDEIVGQFAKTASLISVLTPRYLKSEWCNKEIREFCAAAQQTGGLVVENKCRVFKVIKTPVATEDSLPPVVGKMLGYEFYDLDEDKIPRELDPAYGDKARQEFLRKVNKLAWDLAQLVGQLHAGAAAREKPVKDPNKPTVFLAECSRDQRASRDILEAELKRHGYAVLPDQQLSRDEEKLVPEAEAYLAKCALAIHLIGSSYGLVPDGPSQKSVVVLQNELAARRSQSSGLRRVIWLPEGTKGEQSVQQAFIEALHRNADLQYGADLLTGDLESLKGAIHAALKKLERSDDAKADSRDRTEDGKMVYILCDEKDRKDVVPLLKFLRERQLEVALPIFSGDAAALREANQQLLMTCDALILFYGAGDEAWKFHQQNDLKKIKGLRGKGLRLTEHVYLAGPNSADKELLLSIEEPNLIDGLRGFSETAMEPFLSTLGANVKAG